MSPPPALPARTACLCAAADGGARPPSKPPWYLNAPEATAEAIDPDGWFHTGDIGEFDDGGRLMITDRIKNLIVLDNGKKVSPTPMETKLAGSPYIAQAVIIGDGHASTGALVVPDFDRLDAWAREAGLEPTDTATTVEIAEVITLIEAEMRRLLREFAAYERPRHVALLPRELSEERDEVVGPLRKPKRRVIVANWPAQVERLFPTTAAQTAT